MSKAEQLANDRPTSLNDDLYQWATDAEELLRQQDALLRQALEALDSGIALDDGSIDTDYLDAITAIKEALK